MADGSEAFGEGAFVVYPVDVKTGDLSGNLFKVWNGIHKLSYAEGNGRKERKTDMFESIYTTAADNTIPAGAAILGLLCAVALGVVIGTAYMVVSKKEGYGRDFIIGLVLLPGIVSVVILLVGSNVARAFSMAGAFALVRFRSAPGSAKDIAVVFFAMAAGLACGLGFLLYAAASAAILAAVLVLVSLSGFGEYKTRQKQLKITIPENLNYAGVFEEVFGQFGAKAELRNVRTTNMGTLYELTYWIELAPQTDEKALIDELRVRNGNLNISLGVLAQREQQGMLN